MEELDPGTSTLISRVIGSDITDDNGFYEISYSIPDDIDRRDRTIYNVYTWPSTDLVNAINSSRISLNLVPTKPSFAYSPLPLIYFSDDILGIRGRLVMPNGHNISGQNVLASLSGIALDDDITDGDGVFLLSEVVAPGDRTGIKTISLSTPGNGETVLENGATAVTVIVLPYNRTIVLLALSVGVLSVIALAIAISMIFSCRKRRAVPDDPDAEEKR
jgi:hypothetical protein